MSASTKNARIRRLPPVLIDKIAAGEVIEGPFSVIKELVENSLDAGATNVRIETRSGGMDLILIEDDGAGIHPDDLKFAVQRHATSKISELEDLDAILTFGFRGEALASIASVAHLDIKSRPAEERLGGRIECRGGELVHVEPAGCNPGTLIQVSELFYATPARRKFVKTERTENARNHKAVIQLALANPNVHFTYVRDGKEHLNLPAQSLQDRIAQIYRSKIGEHLLEVEAETAGIRMTGFVTNENFFRANREGQFTFINGRAVDIKNFSYFVKKAYGELMPPGSHPYFFLFLEIDPDRVDVNVHPAKREVRLLDESSLHSLVVNNLGRVLRPDTPLAFARGFMERQIHSYDRQHRPAHQPSRAEADDPVLLEGPEPNRPSFDIRPPTRTAPPPAFVDPETGEIREDVDVPVPGDHPENRESQQSTFLPTRHFGVFYGTYILAEGQDGLYIIDQHTAHERINYEKMRRKMEGMRGQRQSLLHPITIDCLPDELANVLARRDELLESGFLIEEFGPSTYIVREIPPYVDAGTETELILHLIHRVLEGEEGVRLYDEYAAMKACKASIKRNDYVSGEVLSEILRELATCENPSRCPHGRPTMLRISPDELDRMFHRS